MCLCFRKLGSFVFGPFSAAKWLARNDDRKSLFSSLSWTHHWSNASKCYVSKLIGHFSFRIAPWNLFWSLLIFGIIGHPWPRVIPTCVGHMVRWGKTPQKKYGSVSTVNSPCWVGRALEPFSGVEIHMEMDMEWKWMEMGHNLWKCYGLDWIWGRLST